MRNNFLFVSLLFCASLFPVFSFGQVVSSNLDCKKIERILYTKIGLIRSDSGLKPLFYHAELETLARGHGANMAIHRFFGHKDRLNNSPQDRKNSLFPGLIGGVGENLAYNYGANEEEVAERLFAAWNNSTPHYLNMMSTNYSHIGIGVTNNGTRYYGVLVFGDLIAELMDVSPAPDSPKDTVLIRLKHIGTGNPKDISVIIGSQNNPEKESVIQWDNSIIKIKYKPENSGGIHHISVGRNGMFYPLGIKLEIIKK